MYKSTEQHEKYWKERTIDWKAAYTDTAGHSHRALIISALREVPFDSVLELGCASGPNLIRINREFPGVRIMGIDINDGAILEAAKHLPPTSVLTACPLENLSLGDKSVDVVLTDMVLIYINRERIDRVIANIKRVCRKRVVFVEFHSTSVLKRMALKAGFGYYAHDFRKLLERNGFSDISVAKLAPGAWPDGKPQKYFGFIVTAGA